MLNTVASALTLDQLVDRGRALGQRLGAGSLLLLSGEMGAGKTTLTRAIAEGLGVDRPDRVCSPTFNICVVHAGPIPLVHIDLFRLSPDLGSGAAPASFEALGLQELLDELAQTQGEGGALQPQGSVVVIEWAELGRIEASEALALRLSRPRGREDVRDLDAQARGPQHQALLEALGGTGPDAPP